VRTATFRARGGAEVAGGFVEVGGDGVEVLRGGAVFGIEVHLVDLILKDSCRSWCGICFDEVHLSAGVRACGEGVDVALAARIDPRGVDQERGCDDG
jgi:hypothetical protein